MRDINQKITELAKTFPLPQDTYVVHQKFNNKFLGFWKGRWGKGAEHLLVIEYISNKKDAQLVYSLAPYNEWNEFPGVFYRTLGKIEKNILTVTLPRNQVLVQYTLTNNILYGTYNQKARCALQKIEFD